MNKYTEQMFEISTAIDECTVTLLQLAVLGDDDAVRALSTFAASLVVYANSLRKALEAMGGIEAATMIRLAMEGNSTEEIQEEMKKISISNN